MIKIYDRPGLSMSDSELAHLHQELVDVASECFDSIPDYNCLSGRRSEFSRLIIVVSRDKKNRMNGFCSACIIDAGDLGTIYDLGLTCVSPRARGLGLTHKFTSKVVMYYVVKYSPFRPVWISNVACVLSSLGNIALHIEDTYPSPFMDKPLPHQLKIAQTINKNFRKELYISPLATFDEKNFVFKGSVPGTIFEKSGEETSLYHRDLKLNQFYKDLIDFKNGDEVLQIGRVSLMTYPRYLMKKFKLKISRS